MRRFAMNLVLALLWCAKSGAFSWGELGLGFALGYIALVVCRPLLGPSPYYGKIWEALWFVLVFIVDLFASSLRVAYDIVTPRHHMHPAVVAVPLPEDITDGEVALLANTITLTPGTLSLDVSKDRAFLYVHVMYLDDGAEATRQRLQHTVLRRVLQLTR